MAAPQDRKRAVPKLEIKLLGRFDVLRDGEPIPDEAWGRRKTKTLLKVLLTAPGRVFTQDQLIDALFGGENVSNATQNLYSRVSQLRRALEPDLKRGINSAFILREGQGYTFNPGSFVEIDTLDFRRGVDDARDRLEKRDWVSAVARFEEATSLYGGEFLAEDRYEDWAEEARQDFQRLLLDSLTELAKCYEQLGRLRQAISCSQRILAVEPYREDVIQQLMSCLAEVGQRSQAMEAYKDGCRALREHLDVEPSAELQILFAKLGEAPDASETSLDPRRIAVLPFASYSPHSEGGCPVRC